jgi:2,5-dihydroxypyridine 5,6-dioxygenase
MTMPSMTSPRLLRAADNLVKESFAVRSGESVLITADDRTDIHLLDAVAGSVSRAGARPLITIAPTLPYQGGLSDPYVSDPLKAAAIACDVWFDFCFPYHAGSAAHAASMAAKRCRYCLLAVSSATSFERLYGCVDYPAMLEFNIALAEHLGQAAGETVRFTCPRGTDLRLKLDKMKLARQRVCSEPGMHTVPGTQSFYPVMESVEGRIVIQALFDEYYRSLREPIVIEAAGGIRNFEGGGPEDRLSFERALRRASGSNTYGNFVHFTLGFHPAAMWTEDQFIEDIRVPGSNAIGMGLPWWEPGGGENHPDGIVLDQSLWIGDTQMVDGGTFVGPEPLKRLHAAMSRRLD